MITLISKLAGFKPSDKATNEPEERLYRALVGDIGGTNIRLQLVQFKKSSKRPTIIK